MAGSLAVSGYDSRFHANLRLHMQNNQKIRNNSLDYISTQQCPKIFRPDPIHTYIKMTYMIRKLASMDNVPERIQLIIKCCGTLKDPASKRLWSIISRKFGDFPQVNSKQYLEIHLSRFLPQPPNCMILHQHLNVSIR